MKTILTGLMELPSPPGEDEEDSIKFQLYLLPHLKLNSIMGGWVHRVPLLEKSGQGYLSA